MDWQINYYTGFVPWVIEVWTQMAAKKNTTAANRNSILQETRLSHKLKEAIFPAQFKKTNDFQQQKSRVFF
ncbi:hypothetical protein OUZ56_028385 [Daphnia magna]|uniref:Uncharacterized protein n=1 Tax=Daphnia magna TaxID=35525 RepID=A0ABR0B3Q0_9CRUS|nr:hypothetical protein OUZ56_028385 [Daphnia magna]